MVAGKSFHCLFNVWMYRDELIIHTHVPLSNWFTAESSTNIILNQRENVFPVIEQYGFH